MKEKCVWNGVRQERARREVKKREMQEKQRKEAEQPNTS